MLARNPAAAYRRVVLDARIEAAGRADLTRICLEEAEAALGEPLERAQTILLWLARSVAPDHPLGSSLKAFYGGLAGQIAGQFLQADAATLAEIRSDIRDLLVAAG